MSYTVTTPDVLSPADKAAARALIARCNQHEGIDLPITAEISAHSALLLARQGDQLVGLAMASGGRSIEAEICLCVEPASRRQGIGRALLQAALATQPAAAEHILVLDAAGAAGRAFAAALGARQTMAEHRLDLDLGALPAAPPPMPGLHIRPAAPADAAALVAVIVAAFGDPPAMVERFVAERIADPAHRFLLAELAGRAVGALRLVSDDGWEYVSTFGVLPELHGRGVGRRMLLHAIAGLRAAGQDRIRIEVEVDNLPAVGLYESCGFRRSATYAFMTLPA